MELPKRKSIRLKEYDYAANGAYFVTICTKEKQRLLWKLGVGATCGRPFDGNTHLTAAGRVIETEINQIASRYSGTVVIDKYVVMPNHIHLIVVLQTTVDGRPQVAPTISRIVQQFKGSVSKQVGFTLWQKSFYDHVIRGEHDYQEIWQYIENNPLKWAEDCYYTQEQQGRTHD